MHSRNTAQARVIHSLGIICPRSGKPLVRHITSLHPSSRPLGSYHQFHCGRLVGEVSVRHWVEVGGEMEEGTRGAMADIAADHFARIEDPQGQVWEVAEIELAGRVHSKYHNIDECIIVEVKGQPHGQRFHG